VPSHVSDVTLAIMARLTGATRRLVRPALTGLLLAVAMVAAYLFVGPAGHPVEPTDPGASVTRDAMEQPASSPAAPSTEPATAPRTSEPPPPPPPPPRGVTVDGNRLLRDGRPFVPHGFNMIGLLTPDWCARRVGLAARDHFGAAELDAARAWHANTLRFQLSQRGLADPSVPAAARAAYLDRVVAGVALARSKGFVVIVSMQDQSYACGSVHPLPSMLTVGAWDAVVPRLKTDSSVIFELFNEPRNGSDPAGWAQWRDGGPGPLRNLGDPAVGHQTLVDRIRATLGARNVIIADTAGLARTTAGMPLLRDPKGAVAYAVHPYTFEVPPSSWDAHFGGTAATVPVVITEWNYIGEDCGTAKEHRAPEFLDYLRKHGIGVLGHAFDVPGTIVADWAWTPTACGSAVGGAGQVLRAAFG
jgi:hypothetical protein